MDISRQGETIRLHFTDDERGTVGLLAEAARPIIETRCSDTDKAIVSDQAGHARGSGELYTNTAGYERLRDIARVALMTPHVPTRELLAQPEHAAALDAIKQLYATQSELVV